LSDLHRWGQNLCRQRQVQFSWGFQANSGYKAKSKIK
jgi:hypothetical protein